MFINFSHILIKVICAKQNWKMYLFCFLWLKCLSSLLAESLFLYFAQNSAGKIYQSLFLNPVIMPSWCLLLQEFKIPSAHLPNNNLQATVWAWALQDQMHRNCMGLLWLHDTVGLLNPLMVKAAYWEENCYPPWCWHECFHYDKKHYSCIVECVYIPLVIRSGGSGFEVNKHFSYVLVRTSVCFFEERTARQVSYTNSISTACR